MSEYAVPGLCRGCSGRSSAAAKQTVQTCNTIRHLPYVPGIKTPCYATIQPNLTAIFETSIRNLAVLGVRRVANQCTPE